MYELSVAHWIKERRWPLGSLGQLHLLCCAVQVTKHRKITRHRKTWTTWLLNYSVDSDPGFLYSIGLLFFARKGKRIIRAWPSIKYTVGDPKQPESSPHHQRAATHSPPKIVSSVTLTQSTKKTREHIPRCTLVFCTVSNARHAPRKRVETQEDHEITLPYNQDRTRAL